MSDNSHRTTAMTLLTSGAALREKEGQFLGGVAFRVEPLTDKQARWLAALADRHGISGLADGAGQ